MKSPVADGYWTCLACGRKAPQNWAGMIIPNTPAKTGGVIPGGMVCGDLCKQRHLRYLKTIAIVPA